MSIKQSKKLSSARIKRFNKAISLASTHDDVEKAVENAVTSLLHDYASHRYGSDNTSLTYPYNTDGLVEFSDGKEPYSILVETKKNVDMSGSNYGLIRILAQVIYYLKRFELEGEHLPDAVVVADQDEIISISADLLYPYLEGEYDWSIAPSSAGAKSTKLVEDLKKDNIAKKVYIHDLSNPDNFNASDFLEDLDSKARLSETVKITATVDNLVKVFTNFSTDVFTSAPGLFDKVITGDRKRVEVFLRSLQDDDEVYIHPKKKKLIVDDKEIFNVNVQAYEQFWQQHKQGRDNYTRKELALIDSCADLIIDEKQRRMKGDFYTPPLWVDKAHEVIESCIGEDWKDEYVVWDMAAGMRNLTRDYRFGDGNLYTSTLFQEDIDLSKAYNKEGYHFQYDFLNDDMNLHDMSLEEIKTFSDEELEKTFKMPVSLIKAMIEKKPIVFFANPPYGQPGTNLGREHKKGVVQSSIGNMMNNMGHAKMEMYTQFLYRTKLFKEIFEYGEDDDLHLFFFGMNHYTSPSFGNFMEDMTSKFHFDKGFMINAGEFNTAASSWGIIFSHWMTQGEKNQKEFTFDVLKSTKDNKIEKITTWTGKRSYKTELISSWMKEIDIPKELSQNQVLTKNGFDSPTSKSIRCNLHKKWMGYLVNIGSSLKKSRGDLQFYSLGAAMANGRDITKDNFERISTTFSIRRAVYNDIAKDKLLWVREKDLFTTPSEDLLTPEFIADCVVFSLFDIKSNQTSLRGYQYKGKSYTVVNEFFPYSVDSMEELAEEHHNADIQDDVIGHSNRFVYQWLEDHKDDISEEAQALLDEAWSLIEDSFPYREQFFQENPRYQINTWDAGWLQVRRMIFGRDRTTDDFLDRKESFDKTLNALGDKIAQAAYEDGVI